MSFNTDPIPEWPDLVQLLSERFDRLTTDVLGTLRVLLDAGRRIMNCSESALLVPDAEGTDLKFLVSVNSRPDLEKIVTQMSVPRDGSVVGCVFSTGQLMAVANPEDFYQGVREKTGLSMNVYLVTPVISGEEIVGVATFLNRPDDQPQEPFNETEIQSSMKLAELAATSLKYYHRTVLQQELFQRELASVSNRFESKDPSVGTGIGEYTDDEISKQSPFEQVMIRLERMSRREQDLAADLIGVLSSHAEDDPLAY